MRLSDWRKTDPHKESLNNKAVAVLRTVLMDLGAESDPECWVVWGDDPESRYSVLAPATAGVIYAAVRLTGSAEGPRATARLIRWSKLAISELSVEASGGHRIVAVQVENLVLKGSDDEADRICGFVTGLIAGIDNRNPQAIPIAVVQGAAVRGGVVALTGPETKAHPAGPTRPTRPDAVPKAVATATKTPAGEKPKPSKVAVSAAVAAGPAAPKTAAKPAAKQGDKAAHATAPTPAPGALVPIAPAAQPIPPKPIGGRAAAADKGGHPDAGPARPEHGVPEPAADRSEWVSPHPIEEPPSHGPNQPRPWRP
jgi:hypothetical protein